MIEVYGTPTCGKCKILCSRLDEKNIEYTYNDKIEDVIKIIQKYGLGNDVPITIKDDEPVKLLDMLSWIKKQ